jgi:uncharacterized protein YjbI with pentapeptide repeats
MQFARVVSALNGSALNGSALNGSALNGSALNGSALNGSALNGASLKGALGLEQLLATADLTVLQLDYQWPTLCAPDEKSVWQQFAPGLLEQLPTLHQRLYLDPDFHLITNAGGGDSLGCIEALAERLVERDSGQLPLALVRGDQVLARLEEFLAAGHPLKTRTTGKSLRTFTRPLLAAHVELGAGPLKTALDEGARLVVAGCYDQAAPLIAAAASGSTLRWDDYDTLATLALASRYSQTVIGLDENLRAEWGPQAVPQVDSQLADKPGPLENRGCHADVHYALSPSPSGPQPVGQAPSGNWRLRVTYEKAYTSEAMWKLEPSADASVPPLEGELQALGAALQKLGALKIERLHSQTGTETAAEYLRVGFQSETRNACEAVCAALKQTAAQAAHRADPADPRLVLRPHVQLHTAQLGCELPRDQIPVSVETRPAHQWR